MAAGHAPGESSAPRVIEPTRIISARGRSWADGAEEFRSLAATDGRRPAAEAEADRTVREGVQPRGRPRTGVGGEGSGGQTAGRVWKNQRKILRRNPRKKGRWERRSAADAARRTPERRGSAVGAPGPAGQRRSDRGSGGGGTPGQSDGADRGHGGRGPVAAVRLRLRARIPVAVLAVGGAGLGLALLLQVPRAFVTPAADPDLLVVPPAPSTAGPGSSVPSAAAPAAPSARSAPGSAADAPSGPSATGLGRGFPEVPGTLHRGDSGPAVAELQRRLLRVPGVWPDGRVSGRYGAALAEAVARFQQWYGVRGDETGVYGDDTRRALRSVT